ncbi:MAG: paraquat-inducible protein A [Granulosicoccus sp.]
MDTTQTTSVSARELGLKSCSSCGRLQKIADERPCIRCGATVVARRTMSVQRTWAFLLVGMITYIPANTMPILITDSYIGNVEDTIMSGVFSLIATESYFVAGVVFFASICIPIAKFLIIAGLALSLQFAWKMSEHTRHRLHAVTEFIGRWSMIDVFVVAVLAALIQLGTIMTITPGIAISAFAVSVLFTMLAASSLDPRLLWDKQPTRDSLGDGSSTTS